LRKDLDAFFKATERWHLTFTERRTLLGVSSKERWLRCRGAKRLCQYTRNWIPQRINNLRLSSQGGLTISFRISRERPKPWELCG
jgi:hypothetical protein